MEFVQLAFHLASVQYFLTMLPFLIFAMVMHISRHYMWEVCDLFHFGFIGVRVIRLPRVSEETLDFGLLKSVEMIIDYGDF